MFPYGKYPPDTMPDEMDEDDMQPNDDTFTCFIGEGPHSETLMEILENRLPPAIRLFAEKNKGYGDMADVLGSRAQFVDIHRKTDKLKRAIWEGQDIGNETTMEVLQDLFGHVLLMMRTLEKEQNAELRRRIEEEKRAH